MVCECLNGRDNVVWCVLVVAQGLTATLTLTHGIRISGPNVTITFRTDCPNETIYCCQLDDGQFEECNKFALCK